MECLLVLKCYPSHWMKNNMNGMKCLHLKQITRVNTFEIIRDRKHIIHNLGSLYILSHLLAHFAMSFRYLLLPFGHSNTFRNLTHYFFLSLFRPHYHHVVRFPIFFGFYTCTVYVYTDMEIRNPSPLVGTLCPMCFQMSVYLSL